uniref:PAS domain-containing protein n=1 Tax=Alexandrium catenella TaxID=2925 RepID=A0A7S1RJ26_ALECA
MQILYEGVLGIAVVCVAAVLDAGMRAWVRAGVEAEATRGEVHSAACVLLRSFCDVVVDLDAEGRIISDAYDLGGFLLRGRSLKGLRIDELLSNEEGRAALLDKLSTPRADGGYVADVIHVLIRDGNGMVLRVQLFWFDYKGVLGQLRCMVGLRRLPGEQSGERTYAHQATLTPDDEEQTDDVVRSDVVGDQDVHAIVDSGEPGMPIESYSVGFGMKFARLRHRASLLNCVENRDAFAAWVLQVVGLLRAAGAEERMHLNCFRINLCIRARRLTARVTLALQADQEGGERLSAVRLSFWDVKQRAPVRAGKFSDMVAGALRRQDGGEESSSSDTTPRRQRGTKPQPDRESSGSLSASSRPCRRDGGEGSGGSSDSEGSHCQQARTALQAARRTLGDASGRERPSGRLMTI